MAPASFDLNAQPIMADSWSSAATIACGSGAQDCKTRENERHVPGLGAASSCSVSQNV